MNKIVTRINWVNDTDPAINDTHLNQMDSELDAIDDRVIAMETAVITQAENAEAWANGTRGGEAIGPSDPVYHKDAKYQAEQAASSASDAATSETNAGLSAVAAADSESYAAADALVSEGYAKGTQNGQAVGPDSEYYENNAEYFKNQASAIVGPKVTSFNGRNNIVLPAKGDYDADKIEFDPSTTSLPNTLDTLQDFLEYAYPLTITVTLTLNGAKEDSITIYDSNNVQVGSCVFGAGETSGTCQIVVPVGGGNYTFTSSVTNYSDTITLTDNPAQTVNMFPDNAVYWRGNKVVALSTYWNGYGSPTTIVTEYTQHLNIHTTPGGKIGIFTDNAIDLSNYTKIRVTYKNNQDAEGCVVQWGTVTTSTLNPTGYIDDLIATVITTRDVDISSVSTTEQIAVTSRTASAGQIFDIDIYDIVLVE